MAPFGKVGKEAAKAGKKVRRRYTISTLDPKNKTTKIVKTPAGDAKVTDIPNKRVLNKKRVAKDTGVVGGSFAAGRKSKRGGNKSK